MQHTTKHTQKVSRMVVIAMFCAIAYLVMFVLRISGIGGFLTFDMKDAIITVAAMLFGPLVGVGISFAVALLEMVTVSGTGHWGALMNFLSSAAFSATAATVYNHFPRVKKKLSGACLGLGGSIVITVLMMLGMNLIITPIYTHMPVSAIASMILPILLPFNLIKTVLNASLVMLLYKPISTTLRRSGLVGKKEEGASLRFTRRTLLIFLVSAAIAAVCISLLILELGGQFSVFG